MKIPAKYKERVAHIDIDCDGIWIYLIGYYCASSGCHTIHEMTQKDALACLRESVKCDCGECPEW